MGLSALWGWLIWAWVAMAILVAVPTRTRPGGGKVHDRGSMLLIWVVIVGVEYAEHGRAAKRLVPGFF